MEAWRRTSYNPKSYRRMSGKTGVLQWHVNETLKKSAHLWHGKVPTDAPAGYPALLGLAGNGKAQRLGRTTLSTSAAVPYGRAFLPTPPPRNHQHPSSRPAAATTDDDGGQKRLPGKPATSKAPSAQLSMVGESLPAGLAGAGSPVGGDAGSSPTGLRMRSPACQGCAAVACPWEAAAPAPLPKLGV